MTNDRLRGLATQIAQLRHAYSHLAAERVTKQRAFADGLIAPAIRFFEEMHADAEGVEFEIGSGCVWFDLRRPCRKTECDICERDSDTRPKDGAAKQGSARE